MILVRFTKCPEVCALRYFGWDYNEDDPMDSDQKAYFEDQLTKAIVLAEKCNVTLYGFINGIQYRKIAALRPYTITERTSINPNHESKVRVVLFTQHDPSRDKLKRVIARKTIVETGLDCDAYVPTVPHGLSLGCCGAAYSYMENTTPVSWEKALARKHAAKRGPIHVGYTKEHGLLFQFPSDKVPFYVRK